MKKNKIILFLLTLSLFSCSDYLDVNTNPNRLFADQIGADKLLPAAELGAYRNQATTMNQLGNVFMNSWFANVQQYTGGYARETQLVVDNSFYVTVFENIYLNVNNMQKIIELPNADHKNDYSIAAAKILKAHYMQYIVDLYGDAPYTDAFKGLANTTPKYNDDQLIYRRLLTELDEARALISAANPSATDIAPFDIMLKGNMATWAQFANTIELRMLLRMINNTGAVATYRNARLVTLAATNNFLTQSVKINPGFTKSSNEQLNPFYGFAVADVSGATVNNFSFIAPTAHFYKATTPYALYPTASTGTEIIAGSGISYPNIADPRRGRLWRNGAGQTYFRAVTQGSSSVDTFAPGNVVGVASRTGLGLHNPENAVPTIVGTGTIISDGYKVDGYVMTLAEVKFLLAEANLRNSALFPNGSADFDAGINASMTYLGATVGTYITSINTKPNFGWIGTNTEKLHAVMYQKWIGLMGIHGIESFIDYNRTGFPLTPLAVGALQSRKPRRLVYPQSEYIANSVNVPNIGPSNVFALTDSSQPFWMLGDPALGN